MSAAWTPVPKPVESSVTTGSFDAEAIGMLIAITSVVGGGTLTSVVTGWTEISKPTSSIWTLVSKPTD